MLSILFISSVFLSCFFLHALEATNINTQPNHNDKHRKQPEEEKYLRKQKQQSLGSGCGWTGTMSGYLSSATCPTPNVANAPTNCTVTPSYSETSNLWQCPSGNDPNVANACTCDIAADCVTATTDVDTNPSCNFDLSNSSPGCCCTFDGCYVTPSFNWIISTCQGSGCGGYYTSSSTQTYKNIGSQLVVNYIASYQFDTGSNQWILSPSSSFNTDGSRPAFDLVKPYGGLSDKTQAWLSPQPGGAEDWNWGYYPAGVTGIGPPGMMFVLSTEQSYNFAWFMLNQMTLDRGPAIYRDDCSVTNNNCWAAANAGEIDFLEPAWTVNAGAVDNYRRLYATQWNQIGRCFIGDQGSTCNADGGWFDEDYATTNYFLGTNPVTSTSNTIKKHINNTKDTKDKKDKHKHKNINRNNKNINTDTYTPYIWVAVIDSVGTFIYRIPSADAPSIWPGLTETTADCTLQNKPSIRPYNSGPPCDDSKQSYCALFIPNCQANSWGGYYASGGANEGCKTTSDQGWCNNWWNLFTNTNQWLWPDNGTPSIVNFQPPASSVEMPWNYEMEAWKVDWNGNAQITDGCCVLSQGNCPAAPNTTSV